jgi:hypothetical protein
VIRWFAKALRFGDHAAIWRSARPRSSSPGAAWFARRFLAASSIVVRRWGPRWATRRRVLGHEIGSWILALLWIGVPFALLVRATWRLFH